MDISIIIPVYNAKDFIESCIQSVMEQTFNGNLECLLIDDCGTDESINIAKSIIKKYTGNINFRIVHHSCNQGPSAARNNGIREAKGEYVFFLDADDTITPDCIESLYELAKYHDADYVQGRYYNENINANLIPPALTDRKEIKRLLLNHNKIQFTPHNRLARRQMIIDNGLFFNEQIKVREDFLWMTFMAKYVKKFAACDNPTYIRGYNEDSLTNNINKEREIAGYRVLIETMVANYDSFQLGYQKELALEALMMALRAGYYHDDSERRHLIDVVKSKNNCLENILFTLYLRTENSKVLHLLIRLYKIKEEK